MYIYEGFHDPIQKITGDAHRALDGIPGDQAGITPWNDPVKLSQTERRRNLILELLNKYDGLFPRQLFDYMLASGQFPEAMLERYLHEDVQFLRGKGLIRRDGMIWFAGKGLAKKGKDPLLLYIRSLSAVRFKVLACLYYYPFIPKERIAHCVDSSVAHVMNLLSEFRGRKLIDFNYKWYGGKKQNLWFVTGDFARWVQSNQWVLDKFNQLYKLYIEGKGV